MSSDIDVVMMKRISVFFAGMDPALLFAPRELADSMKMSEMARTRTLPGYPLLVNAKKCILADNTIVDCKGDMAPRIADMTCVSRRFHMQQRPDVDPYEWTRWPYDSTSSRLTRDGWVGGTQRRGWLCTLEAAHARPVVRICCGLNGTVAKTLAVDVCNSHGVTAVDRYVFINAITRIRDLALVITFIMSRDFTTDVFVVPFVTGKRIEDADTDDDDHGWIASRVLEGSVLVHSYDDVPWLRDAIGLQGSAA